MSLVEKLVSSNHGKKQLELLYGRNAAELTSQTKRYSELERKFTATFGTLPFRLFSSPGRVEVGGNHTDHNGGKVLTGSLNLDTIGIAAPSNDGKITLISEGFSEMFSVNLNELDKRTGELGTSAILRGICAGFAKNGLKLGGLKVAVSSNVGIGSGISSSASLEMLICTILSHFFCNSDVPVDALARIGQFAENSYWDKPSGLLDQMACGTGGLISIDFRDKAHPIVEPVKIDLSSLPFSFLLVNTGGSHADLTSSYAAIPNEMWKVAELCQAKRLADIDRKDVLSKIRIIREVAGDRALLRAMHFFAENDRVDGQMNALESGDIKGFLRLVKESGRSSWELLQNCYEPSLPVEQKIPTALVLAEHYLQSRGVNAAWRVHGGGFAGTVLVILPNEECPEFISYMESMLGSGACTTTFVRSLGAVVLPE